MATGTGNLPYITDPVSPFDIILAETQNEHIANIQSLADGSGIGDGAIDTSTLANSAVTAEKTAFGGNYSTSEVDTGFEWVDGKTIYKKTVNFGALTNSTNKQVAHGISSLNDVIRTEAWSSDGTYILPVPFNNVSSVGAGIQILTTSTNVEIGVGVDRRTFTKTYVTLYYTKT